MSARSALLVNAAELLREPGTRRRVDVAVPQADVDVVDDRLAGDIAVDVWLASTLDDVEVVGQLRVSWSDACRRCLRPLAEVIVVDVDERYAVPDPTGRTRDASRASSRASEPIATDPDAFPIEHGQLDLAPMVREEILLGVPDAPLCRPDCPGLCPVCGADLQADPDHAHEGERDERWAALDVLSQSGKDPLRRGLSGPVE